MVDALYTLIYHSIIIFCFIVEQKSPHRSDRESNPGLSKWEASVYPKIIRSHIFLYWIVVGS